MIWLLPGFLGRAADWNGLAADLEAAGFEDLQGIDIFAPESHDPDAAPAPGAESGLRAWGDRFAAHVAGRDPRPVVIGYSLGGRLALHALLARPALWRAAVIVSAHTGLSSEAERAARRARDEAWAKRFETEAWDDLMEAWNAQPVFGGRGPARPRAEPDFDRSRLAAALRAWSLGTQENLVPELSAIACPVLWLAGGEDAKFVGIAREAVKRLAVGKLHVARASGHRVPFEAPEALEIQVRDFLNSLLTP